MTSEQRTQLRDEFISVNKRFEKKFFPQVLASLNDKRSSLISTIREHGIAAGKAQLSHHITNPKLSNTVKQMYLEVGLRHARKTHRNIRQQIAKKAANFGYNAEWTSFILNWLQQFLVEKITFDVDETTREKLLEVIQQGIANGSSVDDMVKQLEDLPFLKYQAARIVRTEVNRAANVGTMAAVDTSEYVMNKIWISAHDSRVRGLKPSDHANHIGLDGQIIAYEDAFHDSDNGDLLQFPGDPNASAASTINCRCSTQPIAARNEYGNLIPKPQPSAAPVLGITRPPIAASPNIGLRMSR